MRDSKALLKYMTRLLRLYSKAVFKTFDRGLNPVNSMIALSEGDFLDYIKVEIIPEYSNYKEELEEVLKENIDDLFIKHKKGEEIKENEVILKTKKINLLHLKQFLTDVLNNSKSSKDSIFLISDFVNINDSLVCSITQVDKNTYESYYSLKGENEEAPISLLNSVCKEYIKDCSEYVKNFDTKNYSDYMDFNRTIKKSGENLLKLLGYKSVWDKTFDRINVISSLNYEGNEGNGKIIFTKKEYLINRNHEDIETIVSFQEKIPLSKYRAIRKLLELSDDDMGLLSDAEFIYGVGRVKNSYFKEREDIFIIKFIKHYTWEFMHQDKKMMLVSHEKVSLPKNKIGIYEFRKKMFEEFGHMEKLKIDSLYLMVNEATKQKKGALIVISNIARLESKRLKNQSIPIEPKELDRKTVAAMCSIDGAILLSEEGICYGIGVILDGMASENGNPARGARYNSSIRYIETMTKQDETIRCMAVVISEDGMTDIITGRTIKRKLKY